MAKFSPSKLKIKGLTNKITIYFKDMTKTITITFFSDPMSYGLTKLSCDWCYYLLIC